MIPITLIPATIVGGTLAIVLLYLRWTVYRDERRNRRP